MAENEEQEFKQLRILKSTHDRLTNFGKKSETYDDIINRAIDAAEKGE